MGRRIKQSKLSLILVVVLLLGTLLPTGLINKAQAAIADYVVISQVYGGGGNTGAPYKYDFIELYNPTNQPISLEGWSVQYASATGTSWSSTDLSGTIKAHGYYLIRGAGNVNIGADLPTTPDINGNLNLSGTTGKLALFNKTTKASGKTPTGYIDFIGFGNSADAFEGSGKAPTLSNTTSAHRRPNATDSPTVGLGNGWDSNNNNNDFVALAPNPRNSGSPVEPAFDATAPDAPIVNQVYDADEVIKGTAEADSTVVATVNNQVIGSSKADTTGQFEIQIAKQMSGTTILVTATDTAGNISIATEVVVQQKITQVGPVHSNVTSGTVPVGTEVELSTTTEGATIYYTTNGDNPTEESTVYTAPIVINQTTTIKAFATTYGLESSNIATFVYTIVDETAPAAPEVDPVWDFEDLITGASEADATVVAKVEGNIIGSTTANPIGQYKINIPKQVAGTLITITAIDAAQNESEGTDVIVQQANNIALGWTEDSSPLLITNGYWYKSSSQFYTGNSSNHTYQTDAAAELTFYGSGIRWIALTSPWYGLADVYIDNVFVKEVSLYSTTNRYSQIVFEELALEKGIHTIKIVNKGLIGNDSGKGVYLNIDALEVIKTKDITAPESPSLLKDKKLAFNKSIFSWNSNEEYDLKGYNIYRSSDNISFTKLNPSILLSPSFVDESMETGVSYFYKVTAVDTSGNESNPSIPLEVHAPTVTNWTEDSSPLLFTNGYWYKNSNQLYTDNSSIHTYQTGATAELMFYGSGIRWIALTSPWYGLADVYIDNVFVKEVSLYSTTNRYSQIVFEELALEKGSHTIKIVNKGLIGNDSGKGVYLNIDALEVIESKDIVAPESPTLLKEKKLALNKSNFSWNSNKDHDLKGYNIYRSLDNISFTKSNPSLLLAPTFIDDSMELGISYFYKVTAVDTSGNESNPSKPLEVNAPTVTNWAEDSSPLLFTNGYWYKNSNQLYTDNSSIHTYQTSATAELMFYGSGIRWIALTSPWYGLADVYIDDVFVKEVSLYSTTDRYSQIVFEELSLEKGVHTIKIVNKGLKGNDLGKGVYLNIDALEVVN
jgi:hypothetical protein